MKGFSDKRGLQVIHFVDCPEGVLCELCSKQLPSHAALEKHRKAKHSDISFACEECGKQFKTVKNLLDHQRSHKTCVCYKCGKCISAINYIYISFNLLAYYFDKRRLWDPDQCRCAALFRHYYQILTFFPVIIFLIVSFRLNIYHGCFK